MEISTLCKWEQSGFFQTLLSQEGPNNLPFENQTLWYPIFFQCLKLWKRSNKNNKKHPKIKMTCINEMQFQALCPPAQSRMTGSEIKWTSELCAITWLLTFVQYYSIRLAALSAKYNILCRISLHPGLSQLSCGRSQEGDILFQAFMPPAPFSIYLAAFFWHKLQWKWCEVLLWMLSDTSASLAFLCSIPHASQFTALWILHASTAGAASSSQLIRLLWAALDCTVRGTKNNCIHIVFLS